MLMQLVQSFAAGCNTSAFFGIPPWYQYLVAAGRMAYNSQLGVCELQGGFQWDVQTTGGNDVVLIALGILDILLRVSAFVAIGFVIYASIQYVSSDGQPDRTKEAQTTLINALVGLVIAFIATAAVSFIGRAVSKQI